MTDFWLRYVLALAVMAVMLAACSVIGRRLRGASFTGKPRRIEILESVALAPQAALHLIRIDSKKLLLGTGAVHSPVAMPFRREGDSVAIVTEEKI